MNSSRNKSRKAIILASALTLMTCLRLSANAANEKAGHSSIKRVQSEQLKKLKGELTIDKISVMPDGAVWIKATSRNSGEGRALTIDKSGKLMTGFQDHYKRPSKISVKLANEIAKKSKHDVMILARVPEERYVDSAEELRELLDNRRVAIRAFEIELQKLFHGLKFEKIGSNQPFFRATLASEQVKKLSESHHVLGISLYSEESPSERQLELPSAIQSNSLDYVHNTLNRTGQRQVRHWETRPDRPGSLQIQEIFNPSDPNTSGHSSFTMGIIRNTDVQHGFGAAPGATIYSANAPSDAQNLDFCLAPQRNARTFSQSWHAGGVCNSNPTVNDNNVDARASLWPFPTFVQAAGNLLTGTFVDSNGVTRSRAECDSNLDGFDDPGTPERVNHLSYNAITVGNHDDAWSMQNNSTWENPVTVHNDRELPTIAANGTNICVFNGLGCSGGTSASAPMVAAGVATIHQADWLLTDRADAVRAILVASGRDVDGRNLEYNLKHFSSDGSDGGGRADFRLAHEIAGKFSGNGYSGQSQGYSFGSLSSYSSNPISYGYTWPMEYKIKTSSEQGATIGVALTWNVPVGEGASATSPMRRDIDLLVYDGTTLVNSSNSWDSNVEYLEFYAQPHETYTVKIRSYVTSVSGSWTSNFGLAWTNK